MSFEILVDNLDVPEGDIDNFLALRTEMLGRIVDRIPSQTPENYSKLLRAQDLGPFNGQLIMLEIMQQSGERITAVKSHRGEDEYLYEVWGDSEEATELVAKCIDPELRKKPFDWLYWGTAFMEVLLDGVEEPEIFIEHGIDPSEYRQALNSGMLASNFMFLHLKNLAENTIFKCDYDVDKANKKYAELRTEGFRPINPEQLFGLAYTSMRTVLDK